MELGLRTDWNEDCALEGEKVRGEGTEGAGAGSNGSLEQDRGDVPSMTSPD